MAGNGPVSAGTSGINVDLTAPGDLAFAGGVTDGGSYTSGSVPVAPTCTATDATSGLDGSCTVSGYSSVIGSHTLTATATDVAGNKATSTLSYTVTPVPLNIGLRLDPQGTLLQRGAATVRVSGTVTCDRDATIQITGQLSQLQRRSTVLGMYSTSVSCNAATGQGTWSAIVTPEGGRFLRGSATLSTSASGTTSDGASNTASASGGVTLN